MSKIVDLFKENITRNIEKVITYQAFDRNATDAEKQVRWQGRLKDEISEYCVTESIERSFDDLLGKMQDAMEGGGGHEIGVWVSGFYGSGKSSFTKYLGFALDDEIEIDGSAFRTHLKNRLNDATTKALLDKLAKTFPAAVVMLDLASEMLAGATQQEISTVLHLKVLQWAGYSENTKVAALELRLEKDGRYDEFQKKAEEMLEGIPWSEAHNDPLVMDEIVPALAHEFYPQYFKSANSFTTEASDFQKFENQRVEEMLDLIRRKSGHDHVIFVIDEVGQYVSARPNLILNLDGLAKNIKEIGGGKAWVIATAQQTLTEDDPRAQFNAPQLFKLNDRFPIQIDLEASDIKEICYRRLLGKSGKGEAALAKQFEKHGQPLRNATKLTGAKYYDSDLDKTTFINLYPFLPQHFEILLQLLGRLAKRTGGLGLRSAIKVIQDILIDLDVSGTRVADRDLGFLASTVTLYDSLERDIRKSFAFVIDGVEKTKMHFGDDSIHLRAAKSIAVLQILENLPVTQDNVAALMHPEIGDASAASAVKTAIEEMLNEPFVPLGQDKDGNLGFLSEAVTVLEKDKGEIFVRGADADRIFNERLGEIFSPAPKATLNGASSMATGIKVAKGSFPQSISGDKETIQTVIKFVDSSTYAKERTEQTNESREKANQNTIYLIAKADPETADMVQEIYRCQEIHSRNRSRTEQEIKDYIAGQSDRAERLGGKLKNKIEKTLGDGSFIFRGGAQAVSTFAPAVGAAASKHLASAAAQVFHKHAEAPHRAATNLAERFLKTSKLDRITKDDDPLELVKTGAGQTTIDTSCAALVSIRDYLDRVGLTEGKHVLEYFSRAPYGWSQDTTRYLVAALLTAGEVKLRVSSQDITVRGPEAVEALKTNMKFKNVGVALREGRPSNEVLARASERLLKLSGDPVLPLEEEISKAAARVFAGFQQKYAALENELDSLGLAGAERAASLTNELADTLKGDASDATGRLGGEESPLFDDLEWAGEVGKALHQGGLKSTVAGLQRLRSEISSLPGSGCTGGLKADCKDVLESLEQQLGNEDFHKHAHDFASAHSELDAKVVATVAALKEEQAAAVGEAIERIQASPDWHELDPTEKSELLGKSDGLAIEVDTNLGGLTTLVTHQVDISNTLRDIETQAKTIADGHHKAKAEEMAKVKEGPSVFKKTITLPATIESRDTLGDAIAQLNDAERKSSYCDEIKVTIELGRTDNADNNQQP